MIIVAPIFFNVSLTHHRLIFMADPEKSDTLVASQDADTNTPDEFDRHTAELAYNALEEFLAGNAEISEFFASEDKMASENSMRERAYNDIYERLNEYLREKKEAGIKVSKEWSMDIASLMAETICKVIYLDLMKDVDPLTGRPNRRAFVRRLKEEIQRSTRSGPLSVLIFDLDKFKWVNDTHGHLAGDSVLCEVAEEVKKLLRASDFMSRNGGDEFYFLLPNTDAEGACVVAHRIASVIKGKIFIVGLNGNSKEIQLTASIGISEFEGVYDDPDGSKMINRADECLYIMKGEKPDKNGVMKERRGNIACNGRVLTNNEINRILEDNPGLRLPVDSVISNRERISTGLLEPED